MLGEIKDILNFFGNFTVLFHGTEIHLTGYLLYRDNDVVLDCLLDENVKELIKSHDYHQICGHIAGRDVTLLNCYVSQSFSVVTAHDEGKFTLLPDRILIGKACLEEIQVLKISSVLESINPMFSDYAIEECMEFTREKPSIVEYSFPTPMTANDAEGKLVINRTFSVKPSHDGVTVTSIPIIEFVFDNPTELNIAIAKIASIRNLLAYFADRYLPLGDLTCCESVGAENEKEYSIHCNYEEEAAKSDKPFLIRTSVFENSFQNLWDLWKTFYTDSRPITAMFYEMICNRSTRTNRFLNLCQCLEVFSARHRSKESKIIREKYPPVIEKNNTIFTNWLTDLSPFLIHSFDLTDIECSELLTLVQKQHPFVTEKKIVTLKHRLEDLFLYLNKYLMFSEEKCIELADTISKARNYFTHYGKDRKEPSFECIECANTLLHFVLLLVIYDQLGISEDAIIRCKNRSRYNNLDLIVNKIK